MAPRKVDHWDKIILCISVLSLFSHVWLFATLWTVACQVPLSMGFSRQEYWSGLPFPSSGELSNPEIKSWSPWLQADYCLSHQGSNKNKKWFIFKKIKTNQNPHFFITPFSHICLFDRDWLFLILHFWIVPLYVCMGNSYRLLNTLMYCIPQSGLYMQDLV